MYFIKYDNKNLIIGCDKMVVIICILMLINLYVNSIYILNILSYLFFYK